MLRLVDLCTFLFPETSNVIICAAVEGKNFRVYFLSVIVVWMPSHFSSIFKGELFFLLKQQVEIKVSSAAGLIVKSLLSSPPLPDDLSFPLAVPLHPALPAGTGRRAQRSVSLHCGRGLPIL